MTRSLPSQKKGMMSIRGNSFLDVGHDMFVDKSASSSQRSEGTAEKTRRHFNTRCKFKEPLIGCHIRIVYPDTYHMLIPGVNGAYE